MNSTLYNYKRSLTATLSRVAVALVLKWFSSVVSTFTGRFSHEPCCQRLTSAGLYPWYNFIFLCFKGINIHSHTQKQRKIEFKPKIKLNHNYYVYFVFSALIQKSAIRIYIVLFLSAAESIVCQYPSGSVALGNFGRPLWNSTTYRIYSINRPQGAYSIFGPWRWALIRSLVLIELSPFSASVVCLFCNKIINAW